MEEELRDVVTEVCCRFVISSPSTMEAKRETADTRYIRPTPWRQTGVPSSSSLPTRSPPTQSFASA
jgi:hypothetical protein